MGELVNITDVEILKRGTHNGVEFTDEIINGFVEKYDPVSLHEAQINLGHPDEDTPAEHGAIERIYYEAPVLKADLCRVPDELAREMLHGGKFPYRSIECRGRREETEDGWLEFIPEYLTGLALLGTKPPAVMGMAKVKPEQIHQPEYQHMQVVGFAQKGNWLRLTQEQGAVALHEVTQTKEGPAMADNGELKQEKTISLSEFEAMKLKADNLQKEKDEREAKLAEAEAAKATLMEEKAKVEQEKTELSSEVKKLAETTDHLVAQAALARKNALRTNAERFMEKLRAEKGGTVAALGDTHVVDLMAELDSKDTVLKLADDATVSLGDALRAVLNAIPAFEGHIELTKSGEEIKDAYFGLSASQREMADACGISYEAFAKTAADLKGGA